MSAECLTVGRWVGSADQIEWIAQFARDYVWEGVVNDHPFAAEGAVAAIGAELEGELHAEAESRLVSALADSAQKKGS